MITQILLCPQGHEVKIMRDPKTGQWGFLCEICAEWATRYTVITGETIQIMTVVPHA